MTIYDAEIDLRPYIVLIVKNWWRIAVISLIAIGIALLLGLRQPIEYEATATILLTRSRASLTLATEFPTLNEPVDSNSRMNAFLSIANSDSLAYKTMDLIKDELSPEERDLNVFKEKVSVSNTGDLIIIKARSNDPGLSERIVNIWAQQAVDSINQAYRGGQLPTQIQSQLESAQEDYESSQASLEAFIETSKFSILQNQILELQSLFDSLSNSRVWRIAYYSNRVQDLDQIISRGEALKQQLDDSQGSVAANLGDAMAVLTARATAFGIVLSPVPMPESPTQEGGEKTTPVVINNVPNDQGSISLDLNITDTANLTGDNSRYESDLDTIIQLAEAEKSKAEDILETLSSEVLNNETNHLMQQTAAEIQVLTSQLERETAREKELTSRRDLAWKAYQVMAEKNIELKNATETSSQVSIATLAIPPQKPVSRGLLVKVLVGAVLGLMIGILVVLLIGWWRNSIVVFQRSERSISAADSN